MPSPRRDSSDRLLTIQDLAARWGVDERTVYRWRRLWPRQLRPLRITAQTVRWSAEQVQTFEQFRAHARR